jgi:hypothetical protein
LENGHKADFGRSGGGFLESAAGMAYRVKKRIDSAVLQQSGRFGSLDLFGLDILFPIESIGFEGVNGVLALSGSRIADIDAFALQVLDVHIPESTWPPGSPTRDEC